jgi:ABC-2 type transport system ATP-binding protein
MASGAAGEIRFGAPGGIDTAALASRLGSPVREDRPGEYVAACAATPAAVAALTAWLAEQDLPLADLRAGRQRLEDVFLRLTGDDGPAADGPAADGGGPPGGSRGRGGARRRRDRRR